MEDWKKVIMITGGAGFIGSHLVRHMVKKYPEYLIINFDKLTYAGNLENLKDIENEPNYVFVKGDVCAKKMSLEFDQLYNSVPWTMERFGVTDIIHLAAESHVDRSMVNPAIFAETNIMGTLNLLDTVRECWKDDYANHMFMETTRRKPTSLDVG